VIDKVTIDIGWYVGADPRRSTNLVHFDEKINKALCALREQGIEFEITFRKIEVRGMFVTPTSDRFFITSLTASKADICVYRLADGPIMSKEDFR